MSLKPGRLVYVVDGTPAESAELSDVSGLAGQLGHRLALLRVSRASAPAAGADRSAPSTDAPAETLTVALEHFAAAVATFAAADGRILAIRVARRGGLVRLLAGNHYELLLRDCPLPLLVLPEDSRMPAIRRVLFPADFAPRSEAAFEHALDLCLALGAELHLLHVYGPDGLLPGEQDTARRAATTTIRELLAIDQAQLRALADRARARGLAVVAGTAEGRAHAAIAEYAAAQPIDLIVMATHGPRTAEDILLGSTTARVIQAAPAAVLAMRS